MEGSVFGITLPKILELLPVMKRYCHKARDKFCRHYESKTGFLHGILRVKWLKKGLSPRRIPLYYRK